jgi:hypothetical protein
MRIVSRNVVKRAVLAASATTGALSVDNLHSDDKSRVFRAPGTSVTITGTLPAAEAIACVHLPFCNLSPTATWRIRLYSGLAGVGQLRDTGAVTAAPAPARTPEDWTAAQAASAYSNGGGAHARAWFPITLARSFVIDIVDTANAQGYIEAAAALVAGEYWQPVYGASGVTFTPVDSTEIYRTAGGGQMARAGSIHRRVPVELGHLEPADRTKAVSLMMNSRASPVLVSVFPENVDAALDRDYAVYGRRARDIDVAIKYAAAYSSTIDVEEI